MIECTMTSNLSLALRPFSKGLVLGMAVLPMKGRNGGKRQSQKLGWRSTLH
jgi:hypothetical protein